VLIGRQLCLLHVHQSVLLTDVVLYNICIVRKRSEAFFLVMVEVPR
jgi:hypothetical protein